MMKRSRGVFLACLLTLAALGCESVIPEIKSINDLKEFLPENPTHLHSLSLLHWFANSVHMNHNNEVQVTFGLNGDFGSEFYSNTEGLLPPAPQGHQYYTVGNVDQLHTEICPLYHDLPEYFYIGYSFIEGADIARYRNRIILSVQKDKTVSQVYLTQHFSQGSRYDPDQTYSVSTALLRELTLFSVNDKSVSLLDLRDKFGKNINDSGLNQLINVWGREQAPLGLLHLIVMPKWNNQVELSVLQARNITPIKAEEWQNCETKQMHVQVNTGNDGKAVIVWQNVPGDLLNDSVAVALFNNQMDEGESLKFIMIQTSEGRYLSTMPLNEGLQVRLHKTKENSMFLDSQLIWTTLTEEICRGKELTAPLAVSVTAYAQLQLFVRDGNACFRLLIKKGCDQWKTDFHRSWVGLYRYKSDTSDYLSQQWQWATELKPGQDYGPYNTFEYCTSTRVVWGLHARFMTKRFVEKVRTPIWTGIE